MRCMTTASLRATAVAAVLNLALFASLTPHALSLLHFRVRVSFTDVLHPRTPSATV